MVRLSRALAAGLLLAGLTAAPHADEGPAAKGGDKAAGPAGAWKLSLPLLAEGGKPLWLVKFAKKDGGWSGEVLATAARVPEAKGVGNVVVTADRLSFTLKSAEGDFPFRMKLAKEGKGEKLFGLAVIGKSSMPAELEKTTLGSLDPFEMDKEALAKQPAGVEAVKLALKMLGYAEAKKVKPAEVRAWAEKAVRSAELYGPAYQRDTLRRVATGLLEEKGYEAVALQYARRAERLLEKKDPPGEQKEVLDVLAAALEKAGKGPEAALVSARIKKLDFSIKPRAFAGRKGKSGRVVLVEQFLCANDPRGAAADLAFAALAKTYKPAEVVLLQYHRNEPQPDPLASPDGLARFNYYEDAFTRTVLGVIVDGSGFVGGGGDAKLAAEFYDEYQRVIDAMLEKEAKAEIKLAAVRKGDKVSISVEVGKLAETGDAVHLRLALVEEQVAYRGANGVAVHPHVVRSMPGGEAGVVLKEKAFKKTYTVDLAQLRKDLKAALDKAAEKRPFPTKERPLELKKLRVVAFVQDDKKFAVLQAAQADVKGE
jgi:hypothetical protein